MAAGRIKGITIEIGGDTTKLTKALASVDNAISHTQQNLRDIDKALKLDPSNINLLKDKQQELASEISNVEEKLKNEREALKQMSEAEGFDKNSQAARDLQTQIDLDTATLKELRNQAKESASVIGTVFQEAGKKLQDVGDKIKGVGDKIKDVGSTLTQKVTVPIAAAFGASVKEAIDWESAFTGVMKTVDETANTTYDDLKQSINEIAKTTASSQNEIAAVMEIGGQLGVAADDIAEFTKNVIMLGDTTNLSSEEAATAIARYANVTGMSISDTSKLGSVIVDLGNNFATTEADIMAMAQRLSGAGSQIGLSQGEVLGFATALSSVGIEAEMGGSAFSKAMIKMQVAVESGTDSYENFRKKLAEIQPEYAKLSSRDVQIWLSNDSKALKDIATSTGYTKKELTDLINTRANLENFADVAGMTADEFVSAYRDSAPTALQAFIQGLGDTETKGESTIQMLQDMGFTEVRLRDTLTRLASSGDLVTEAVNKGNQAWAEDIAMQNEADKRYGTMESKISQLKARITELAVGIGETLMPFVEKGMAYIDQIIEKWNALSPAQQEMILKIAAISAAVGPLLIVIGSVVGAIGTIISAVGSVVGAIGGAISAISGIGTAISGVITSMGGLSGVMAAIVPVITGPIGIIVAAIAGVIAIIAVLWNTNEEFREGVKEIIGDLIDYVKDFIGSLQPIFDQAKEMVSALKEFIITLVKTIIDTVKKFLEDHKREINAIMITLKTIVLSAMDVIKNVIKNALDMIKGIVKTGLDLVTGLFKTFTLLLKGDWKGALDALLNTAKNVLKDLFNIFDKAFDNLGNLFSDLVGRFKDWGKDMIDNLIEGIKDKISGIADAIGDVAGMIADFLHFSEPDKGPLKNFHTFMPDMMKEMVQGIKRGLPMLNDAMDMTARALVPATVEGITSSNVTSNNNVNITVYGAQGQDVNELASIIQQKINLQVNSRGAVFS